MSGKNIEKYVRFLFDELKIKWIYKQIFDKERLCIKQAPYFCLNIKSMGLVLILTQMTDLGLSGIT